MSKIIIIQSFPVSSSDHIKSKMVKQAKAEGQPKRPMSAYFLWMNTEGRAMVKKNNPDAPIIEISQKRGEEWKALGEAARRRLSRNLRKSTRYY